MSTRYSQVIANAKVEHILEKIFYLIFPSRLGKDCVTPLAAGGSVVLVLLALRADEAWHAEMWSWPHCQCTQRLLIWNKYIEIRLETLAVHVLFHSAPSVSGVPFCGYRAPLRVRMVLQWLWWRRWCWQDMEGGDLPHEITLLHLPWLSTSQPVKLYWTVVSVIRPCYKLRMNKQINKIWKRN